MLPLKIVRDNDKKHEDMMRFYMKKLEVADRSSLSEKMKRTDEKVLKSLWKEYHDL